MYTKEDLLESGQSGKSSDESQVMRASTGCPTTLVQPLLPLEPRFLHYQIVSRLTLALPLPQTFALPPGISASGRLQEAGLAPHPSPLPVNLGPGGQWQGNVLLFWELTGPFPDLIPGAEFLWATQ